jgi:hypothetical protein
MWQYTRRTGTQQSLFLEPAELVGTLSRVFGDMQRYPELIRPYLQSFCWPTMSLYLCAYVQRQIFGLASENRSPELQISVRVFWGRHDRLAGHATSHHVSRTLPLSWRLRVRFRCTVHSTVLPPLCPELGHASDVPDYHCDLAAFWVLAVSATVKRMMYLASAPRRTIPEIETKSIPDLNWLLADICRPHCRGGGRLFSSRRWQPLS